MCQRQIPTLALFVNEKQKLCFVLRGEPITKAMSLMVANCFSQLVVVRNNRSPLRENDILGVVTWENIGKKLLSLSGNGADLCQITAGDCTSKFVMKCHDESEYVKDVAETMRSDEYIVIKNGKSEVVQIVTHYDLAQLYLNLVKPYSEIEAIELKIRKLFKPVFSVEELKSVGRDDNRKGRITGVDQLEFGEYISLFDNFWSKFETNVDKSVLHEMLDRTREIRNDVMHFRPEGISKDDAEYLEKLNRLLDCISIPSSCAAK